MPKSRVRKNHKQKVQARNAKLAIQSKKFEKEYLEMMTKQLQNLESKFSGLTEETNSTETTQEQTNGFVQSTDNI